MADEIDNLADALRRFQIAVIQEFRLYEFLDKLTNILRRFGYA